MGEPGSLVIELEVKLAQTRQLAMNLGRLGLQNGFIGIPRSSGNQASQVDHRHEPGLVRDGAAGVLGRAAGGLRDRDARRWLVGSELTVIERTPVFVLCGGLGTRLREETEVLFKNYLINQPVPAELQNRHNEK